MKYFYSIALVCLIIAFATSVSAQSITPTSAPTIPVSPSVTPTAIPTVVLTPTLPPFNAVPPLTDRFFEVQAIDTMKLSRDAAQDRGVDARIPEVVRNIASMHATHIALGTTYNEEFYPVMKLWVEEARKYGLNIWFRGNVAQWEGWYNYPKFTDPAEHHAVTKAFIVAHPDLFQPGDIFTPAPEPENGGYGDPRTSPVIRQQFNTFLIDSYNNCQTAFAEIQKTGIKCGYFSTNGDVAKESIDTVTYSKIGNIIVIDHYVKTPAQMAADIEVLAKKNNMKVVVGEFGAPIPDINGPMTQQEQANFVRQLLMELVKVKSMVAGVNYWTVFGGSTALYTGQYMPKPVTNVLTEYYQPIVVTGRVSNIFNRAVPGTKIYTVQTQPTYTDRAGVYRLLTTKDFKTLTSEKTYYYMNQIELPIDQSTPQASIRQDVKLKFDLRNFKIIPVSMLKALLLE